MDSSKKDAYKLLNLNKSEIKIFECLTTPKLISEVAKETRVPRMTVHITLKRFEKRGLIKKEKYAKRFLYSQIENVLENRILPINEYENIVIHRGAKELFETWNKMTKLKSERYMGYQPNSSIAHSLKKVNMEELMKLNNEIRENDHIVDAFLEKGFMETAEKLIPKKDYKPWAKSLKRKSIVYEVDKDMFQSKNEVFIIRDSIFITDWEKEICVEIKQLETVNLMKNFFELLKLVSSRVDFNHKLN